MSEPLTPERVRERLKRVEKDLKPGKRLRCQRRSDELQRRGTETGSRIAVSFGP